MKIKVNFVLVTILHLILCRSAAGVENFTIALKYFKLRNIGAINIVFCGNFGKLKDWDPEITDFMTNLKLAKSIGNETLHNIFGTPPQLVGAAVNLDCPGSWEVLHWISRHRSFNASFAFGLITKMPINDTLRSVQRLGIAYDSDIVVFSRRKVYDVYRTAKGEPLSHVEIGSWTETGQLSSLASRRRWDLKGATLKACTVLKFFPKELFLKKEFYDHDNVPYMDSLSRFPCRQQRSIEKLMNFKTNLSLVPDWGYWDEEHQRFDKGSMYGSLQDGDYEFGLTLSWMYSQRIQSVFFAPVTHPLKSCVVFRHPPAGASVGAFSRPFSWRTWLVILLFLVTGTVSLHLIIRFVESDRPHNEVRFSNSLFHIAGVFCLKCSYVDPTKFPTRVLVLFFQIMALMTYSYYGATILGFLLRPSPRTITTVDKLLDSHMDLWAESAGVSSKATKFYYKAIKGPTKEQDRFISLIKGLKMVQKGGTGLYGLTPNLYENIRNFYSNSEVCSLYFMDLLSISTATPIQKLSPYREMYYKAISWMIESGLNNYEEKHWHAQKPQCVGTEENVAVKLEATSIAQIIYAGGLLLALIIFTIEKSSASRKEEKLDFLN